MKNPFKRAFLRLASNSLERYEKDVLDKVDVVVAISESEADGYRNWRYSGPLKCVQLWSGHHLSEPEFTRTFRRWTSRPTVLCRRHGLVAQPRGNRLVHRLRLADAAVPASRLGVSHRRQGPPPLRRANVAGVVNRGEVPDTDVFANERDLLVVPLLRGAGIRVKIVQAMAKGIPVATTTKGGQGLGLDNGEGIALDHPDAFADCISEIVRHPKRLTQLGEHGRTVARTRFDRRVIAQNLMGFYGRYIQP